MARKAKAPEQDSTPIVPDVTHWTEVKAEGQVRVSSGYNFISVTAVQYRCIGQRFHIT